jgi:hypothetical protein
VVCDDQNACTNDACVEGECEYTEIICNDNDPCTTDECVEGDCVYTDTGLDAEVTGTNPTSCDACDGTARVISTGGTPPYSYLWSTGDTTDVIGVVPPPFNGTRKCINSGGPQYIASTGDTFLIDQLYSPGSPGTVSYSNPTNPPIAGTIDDALYSNERNVVGTGDL